MCIRDRFSSELLENPMLLKTTLLSIVTIVFAAGFGPLQRVLDTVDLSADQWLLCIAVAASIIVVSEVKKLLRIRTGEEPAAAPVAVGAAA